jgi:hypothetical protein
MNGKLDMGKSEARPHPGPLPQEREKRSQRLGKTVRRMIQGFNARRVRGNLSPFVFRRNGAEVGLLSRVPAMNRRAIFGRPCGTRET